MIYKVIPRLPELHRETLSQKVKKKKSFHTKEAMVTFPASRSTARAAAETMQAACCVHGELNFTEAKGHK